LDGDAEGPLYVGVKEKRESVLLLSFGEGKSSMNVRATERGKKKKSSQHNTVLLLKGDE